MKNGTISGEMVLDKYPNPQNSKIVLRLFEEELEKCHDDNDLRRAFKLIQIMSDSNIEFDNSKENNFGGSTFYTSHKYAILASESFLQWMYNESKTNGTKIETEDVFLADCTYQVYDTKITYAFYHETEDVFMAYVYLPSVGWYEIENGSNYSPSVYAQVD